ncbi:MAG: hypothetical protein LBS01_00620 [Prevotellaceae bacterium]|jgi:hypothetical protein|nr:hypothetical protein [Prevotellaceae bacterium]
MKKSILILGSLALMSGAALTAQVGVNTETPAATLDLTAVANDTAGILVPRLTLAELNARHGKYGDRQNGAMVFITDVSTDVPVSGYSDAVTCVGFAHWQKGSNPNTGAWVTDCAAPKTYAAALMQPKAFTFYENPEGNDVPVPLVFGAGGSSAMTYQWYKITGNNVHIRIAQKCTASDGSGFATNAFTPTSVIKGTTRNANNTGFYRYFCVAKNATNDSVVSNIAEVAVGCGAKNLQGEWLSFMCFNLGATELTIAAQKNHSMTFSTPNDADGGHYYIADEEQVYGDLYQWGRIRDGHEQRGESAGFVAGSNAAGTNQAAYNALTPIVFEDGNLIGPSQHYPWRQVSRYDNNHYGKFITTGSAQNANWAYDLPANEIDQLWRTGRFAANDPCAKINADGLTYETFYPETDAITTGANTNWKTPSQDEWGSIYRGGTVSGSQNNALANTWTWYNNNGRGFDVKPDGSTITLHLPASGFRHSYNGRLHHQGSLGYYWSILFSGTNANVLLCYNGDVNPAYSISRGYGFTLRCIKHS